MGAFATLIAAIASVLRFIVDLFFTVLAVVGCPAEAIAARVRNMLTFPSSSDGGGGASSDLEQGSGASPPWAQASQGGPQGASLTYAPVATAEAEMVTAVPVGTSESTTSEGEERPAVKADRSALLAAAEARARGHKI